MKNSQLKQIVIDQQTKLLNRITTIRPWYQNEPLI